MFLQLISMHSHAKTSLNFYSAMQKILKDYFLNICAKLVEPFFLLSPTSSKQGYTNPGHVSNFLELTRNQNYLAPWNDWLQTEIELWKAHKILGLFSKNLEMKTWGAHQYYYGHSNESKVKCFIVKQFVVLYKATKGEVKFHPSTSNML